jgi:hypothetical protein
MSQVLSLRAFCLSRILRAGPWFLKVPDSGMTFGRSREQRNKCVMLTAPENWTKLKMLGPAISEAAQTQFDPPSAIKSLDIRPRSEWRPRTKALQVRATCDKGTPYG